MKLILLIKRKQGLTPEQFRDHYENIHAPLAERLLPYFATYRRNYIRHDVAHVARSGTAIDKAPQFDVMTELTFASPTDYQRMIASFLDPAIADQIAQDESRFQDRDATLSFFIEIDPAGESTSDIQA